MVLRLQSNRQYYNEHDRNLFRNMANVRGNFFRQIRVFFAFGDLECAS